MTNQTKKPQFYCVGGSVRDTLLNLPVRDQDYVVVGASYEHMIAAGYKLIESTSFPVFHDSNGNEHALARTERKTGKGYHGFEINFDSSVTLEDDLFRRDLTINSLAVRIQDWKEFHETRNPDLVIDPFGGIQDLKDGILRHVSEAFADDPVRILRIARFRARYHSLRFDIAEETRNLMLQMVDDGEVDHLVPERVWAETEKALMEDHPEVFFLTLSKTVLRKVMPIFSDVKAYTSIPFKAAAIRDLSLKHRLMLLTSMSDFNEINDGLRALKVPVNLIDSCLKFNTLINVVNENSPPNNMAIDHEDVFDALNALNAWKCRDQLRDMGIALSMFSSPEMDGTFDILMECLDVANTACFDMLTDEQQETLKGKEIGEAISALRRNLLREIV